MKVLHYLFFPAGGIGRYQHDLLPYLCEAPDIDVELACLPGYTFLEEASYPCWPGLFDIEHRTPPIRRMRFLAGQWINPLRLAKRAREWQADIIHLNQINYLSFAQWEKPMRQTGAKVVATVHTTIRNKGLICLPYERRQLAAFYRFADHLFVHNPEQVEDLVRFAGMPESKISLVPMGPMNFGGKREDRDAMRVKYDVPPRGKVALFFGDMRPDKNLDLLLEAMVPHRDAFYLVIAGRPPSDSNKNLAYYEASVERLGLVDRVRFIPRYVHEDEVVELFSLADWAAMPYRASFTSQSGVLSVAAHFHTPVLGTTCPSIRQAMSQVDIGVMVDADDRQAYQVGIATMHERLVRGDTFEFDRYHDLFSWRKNACLTHERYRELVAS